MINSEPLKTIGHINSPFKQKFGTPRQSGLTPSALATIVLDREFVTHGALDGLEEFSHLWILFLFHKNTHKGESGKVFPPRLKGEKRGIFATRTPHRPNSIGLSLVAVHKIIAEDNKIQVLGADLVDGTPIVDLKPYLPQFESVSAKTPAWVEQPQSDLLKVTWLPAALKDRARLSQDDKRMIEEVLRNDIRNVKDKGDEFADKQYRVYLKNFDVWFHSRNGHVEIIKIKFEALPKPS